MKNVDLIAKSVQESDATTCFMKRGYTHNPKDLWDRERVCIRRLFHRGGHRTSAFFVKVSKESAANGIPHRVEGACSVRIRLRYAGFDTSRP